MAEYLFRSTDRLDAAIDAAIHDKTHRSDDTEFVVAARGWSQCVSFGNFDLYKLRFEETASEWRFAGAQPCQCADGLSGGSLLPAAVRGGDKGGWSNDQGNTRSTASRRQVKCIGHRLVALSASPGAKYTITVQQGRIATKTTELYSTAQSSSVSPVDAR